jgi:predicted small lipoprotein YifL
MGKSAVLMVAAAVMLAGCGQKGPLYLPDKGGTVVTRPGGGQARQPDSQPQSSPRSEQSPPSPADAQPLDAERADKKSEAR